MRNAVSQSTPYLLPGLSVAGTELMPQIFLEFIDGSTLVSPNSCIIVWANVD